MDAQRQLLFAAVRPPQVGVLDVRIKIAAGELSITVRLEPEPRRHLLAVRPVIGEIQAPEPEPLLSLDGGWIVDADLILMPLVVPVVVAEHQTANLAEREFGFRLFLCLRKLLAR